jgi:capsular polysaccharide biosynthesis protein
MNRKMINDILCALPVTSKRIGYPRRRLSMRDYADRFPTDAVVETIGTVSNRGDKLPALLAGFPVAKEFSLFTARLNNARVWGRNGAVIAGHDCFIVDVSREFNQETGFEHSVFYTIRQQKPRRLEGRVAVIGTAGANVYYHWMLDIIPRLGLLQQQSPLSEFEHFVTDYEGLGFQKESLEAANIGEDRVLVSNNNWGFHLECATLFVPSLAGALGQPNLFQVSYLRSLFHNWIYAGKPYRKIYISRAGTGRRMIMNEAELLPLLKTNGFEVLNCEEMALADQVRSFSQAAVIVGSHGSAFTNLVFCQEGTSFFEIFNETHIQPCFWFISNLRSMRYYSMQGKSVAVDKNSKNDNTYIDAKLFSAMLSTVMKEQ